MISCVSKHTLQINQVDDSPVLWGGQRGLLGYMEKLSRSGAVTLFLASLITAIKNQYPSVMKVQGLTRITNETCFYSRRATNFSPALGESWALAKSQSLHSHRHKPFQIPSTEEKKHSRKAKSQTQKGVAHREKNNTKTQCKPC